MWVSLHVVLLLMQEKPDDDVLPVAQPSSSESDVSWSRNRSICALSASPHGQCGPNKGWWDQANRLCRQPELSGNLMSDLWGSKRDSGPVLKVNWLKPYPIPSVCRPPLQSSCSSSLGRWGAWSLSEWPETRLSRRASPSSSFLSRSLSPERWPSTESCLETDPWSLHLTRRSNLLRMID